MKRILVVEDNRLETRLLQHLFHKFFQGTAFVDFVPEGITALKYLSRCKYDLMITDLIMPGMDGIELIQLVKNKYKHTHIIALTGSNPFYLHFAQVLGADAIFTKPLEVEQLIYKVKQILGIGVKTAVLVS